MVKMYKGMSERIVKHTSDASWPSAEAKAKSIAQAKTLRRQAAEGGLRFNAYLPPELADWLLARIEQGMFVDPSEAVFVILGEHEQLEPHADLRAELLRRTLQSAIDDPRSDIPAKQVFEELRKELSAPRTEPVCWEGSPAK